MFADYVNGVNEADHNDLFEDNGDIDVVDNGPYGTVYKNCAYSYS